jgi:hypothetical protein
VFIGSCCVLCSSMKEDELKVKRLGMLTPCLMALIPTLVSATQYPKDFNELEADKQHDFRAWFRWVAWPLSCVMSACSTVRERASVFRAASRSPIRCWMCRTSSASTPCCAASRR